MATRAALPPLDPAIVTLARALARIAADEDHRAAMARQDSPEGNAHAHGDLRPLQQHPTV